MKFVHFSDTHLRKEYLHNGLEDVLDEKLSIEENLRETISDIDWSDVDFLVITGDLVHEGNIEDYKHLKNVVNDCLPKNVAVHYVLGNHDNKKAFYQGCLEQDSEKEYYYQFDMEGYRLIVLDSAIPNKESGTITKEQLVWLKIVLEEPSEKGTLLFLHHPVFWNTRGLSMELTNGETVMEIVKDTDVLGIFCGHTHSNAVQMRDGIMQCTADSMAFSIKCAKGKLEFNGKAGYNVVEIKDQQMSIHEETIDKHEAMLTYQLVDFMEQMAKLG